ncbi:Helix-turn-helix domain [Mycobacteroides abscessus subsp. abscessus]|uniref:helix-turn-helix domain-containing protein n=1 Tax=Mycobacteroides abscessus TaxID=36809 RepID=UPI00092BCB3D|nr:helix-turn-helix domain-containing protein [Mycobacteroides abscessus]MDO3315703.1 helix-turn-helix domain-containing protein [Mycobacteroides abscessus subsp. abscessus]MDO3343116.1 helix-turn-helix domain-containing protein [Mycobacteroides abscessus subsp. abscessus]SHP29171.1 Helix-turn-helix domain [Mycobacteroides abscessus subsp. abscessus]SHP46278.1 Helix-turn-helix domain [Mycobacteroides abscessus subsp. abscessus]SHP49363.1 Helix-turn-helix domain [Mycobacteroides abscessus subsp
MQEDESTQPNKIVGRNTAQFRGQKGLSQAELATRLATQLGKNSVDPTTITRLESGKRPTTVDELVALAQILDVDVNSLLHPGLNAARLFALQRTVAQLREHLAAMKGLLFTVDGVLVYNPELLERLSAKDRELIEGLSEYLAYDADAEA